MTVPTSWASRLTSAMAVGGTALSSAEQIAMSAAMAAETAMTNMAMSQIGQEAAIQAAALKLGVTPDLTPQYQRGTRLI